MSRAHSPSSKFVVTHKKRKSLLLSSVSNISKRVAWTTACIFTCFAVVNTTAYLQTQMCMFHWDRPETWGYTFALTGSPMCRMLSQTNSFFHHAAGTFLNVVF